MKKITLIVFSLLLMAIVLSSCMIHKTTHTNMGENYVFSKYEKVMIYDNESDAELGYFQINDVYVLIDEPFSMYEEKTVTKENGETETVKEWTTYEALVQITYDEKLIDSSARSYFSCKDINGKFTESFITVDYEAVPTNSKYKIEAIENKGEYIGINYYYQRSHYEPTARIRAEYNTSVQSEKPELTPEITKPASKPVTSPENKSNHSLCIIIILFLGMLAIGFFTAFIIMLNINKRLRRK